MLTPQSELNCEQSDTNSGHTSGSQNKAAYATCSKTSAEWQKSNDTVDLNGHTEDVPKWYESDMDSIRRKTVDNCMDDPAACIEVLNGAEVLVNSLQSPTGVGAEKETRLVRHTAIDSAPQSPESYLPKRATDDDVTCAQYSAKSHPALIEIHEGSEILFNESKSYSPGSSQTFHTNSCKVQDFSASTAGQSSGSCKCSAVLHGVSADRCEAESSGHPDRAGSRPVLIDVRDGAEVLINMSRDGASPTSICDPSSVIQGRKNAINVTESLFTLPESSREQMRHLPDNHAVEDTSKSACVPSFRSNGRQQCRQTSLICGNVIRPGIFRHEAADRESLPDIEGHRCCSWQKRMGFAPKPGRCCSRERRSIPAYHTNLGTSITRNQCGPLHCTNMSRCGLFPVHACCRNTNRRSLGTYTDASYIPFHGHFLRDAREYSKIVINSIATLILFRTKIK